MKSKFFTLFVGIVAFLIVVAVWFALRPATPKTVEEKSQVETAVPVIGKTAPTIIVHLMRPGDAECDLSLYVLNEIAHKMPGRVIIRNINVDKEPEVSSFYRVLTVPTILLLDSGKRIAYRHEGYVDGSRLMAELKALTQ